jgi:hypothetical protein
MPAAVMYKGRAERPRTTGTAGVAVPTRRSAGIGATPVGGITLSDGEDHEERAPSRRYAPSQVFRACLLASCRSGCCVYSWLGRAPVADRRVQQPGRAVGTAHRGRNAVVEVQPAERGRPAYRRRRRWRGIYRRAGDWARRTGHQPGDRLLTSRSMSGAVLRAGHASMVADNQSRPA